MRGCVDAAVAAGPEHLKENAIAVILLSLADQLPKNRSCVCALACTHKSELAAIVTTNNERHFIQTTSLLKPWTSFRGEITLS